MSAHGVVTAPGTIQFQRTLPGPIERVWAFLTEPEQRARWLAGGPMEPNVGGAVALHFRHVDLSPTREPVPERYRQYEAGGIITGHVTRWEPYRVLAYTWEEGAERHTEVTFELTATGDDVHLVLTHRLLEAGPEMLSVASGWHTHLDVLIDRLEGRDPSPFWSTHSRLESVYERVLAGPVPAS